MGQSKTAVLIFFLVIGLNLSSGSSEDEVFKRDFRLPRNILPNNYNLKLFIVLDPLPGYERFTATGEVSINVTCLEKTNWIFLHAVNLTIDNETVSVSDSNGVSLPIQDLEYELDNDFFIISLNNAMEKGETYKIDINFTAPIPDYRLNGMYQDFYEDPETGKITYLATTLFAPYHARRLFPCFDEPSFRAEYDVTLGHHTKYHAMANQEILSSHFDDTHVDYQWDHFKTTPGISSYITAMIVSDFTYVEAPPNYFENKTIRVYAAPHLVEKGASDYGTNLTDSVMAFLENRFQIKYPLDKLFSIALPHFFFSAMENIGMITYKEPVILYLKNETTEEERFQIHSTMGHELSHQWFGNIVALKWWAYVWLKEGFSTFYSYHAMQYTNPEFEPWNNFGPVVREVAMRFDASNRTHPLENFPPSSAAVADIYSSIPYQKGASILRMTSTFLTEEVFEEGVKIYLNRFSYSSAEQRDLFTALQEALDENPLIHQFIPASVAEIMNSWCTQSRFPLIFVNRAGRNELELTQVEIEEEEGSSSTFPDTTWWVPITLQPRTQPNLPGTVPDLWIPQGIGSLTMNVSEEGPIIVDPEGTGYYRVLYEEEMLKDILNLLKIDHERIPVGGRSKLLDDAFQLSLAGYLSLSDAMEFTGYMDKEMSYGVWLSLTKEMDGLLDALYKIKDESTAELLEKYLLEKVTTVFNRIIAKEESKENSATKGAARMLKELLMQWSCHLGTCLGIEEEEVIRFIADNDEDITIEKEKQFPLYCSALAEDLEVPTFDRIIEEFENTETLFGKKARILRALPCTSDVSSLKLIIIELFDQESKYFALNEKLELLLALSAKENVAEILLNKILEYPSLFLEQYEKIAADVLYGILSNLKEGFHMSPKFERLMQKLGKEKVHTMQSKLLTSKRHQSIVQKSSKDLQRWLNQNI